MKKIIWKGLSIAIMVLFVGSNIVQSTLNIIEGTPNTLNNKEFYMDVNHRGDILYVGGSGPGNYSSIQNAIDDSSDGNTVFVYDDSSPYYENIDIDRSIQLIGENRDTTIIDGGDIKYVIDVTAPQVIISGFTIQNGTSSSHQVKAMGIWLNSNAVNCQVKNNVILMNRQGIQINSVNNIITDNKIEHNNYNGILLENSLNNTIFNNSFIKNGIIIEGDSLEQWNSHSIANTNYVNSKPIYYLKNIHDRDIPIPAGEVIIVNCSNILAENLNLSDSDAGVLIAYSSDNTILNNTLLRNNVYGIKCHFSDHNNLIGNIMDENRYAIRLTYSDNNNISFNTITSSGWGIRITHDSKFISIYGNTVSSSQWSNIEIGGDGSNCIMKNRISDSHEGLYIQSDSNTIAYNYIDNNVDAISLVEVRNTTLYRNTITENNNGLGVSNSQLNKIYENNIFDSVSFWREKGIIPYFNSWNNNYWGRIKILPKVILGSMIIYQMGHDTKSIPIFNFDWHPAKTPYEI